MPLEVIDTPERFDDSLRTNAVDRLIDDANDAIERYMLTTDEVSENFVTCDFHMVAAAIAWMHQSHLLTGNRFCEWGSGFGLITMLAGHYGMDSFGIEIEASLIESSRELAKANAINATFCQGSFLPRSATKTQELAPEISHVSLEFGDAYAELDMSIDEFDLVFAFPWPGEQYFFESLFEELGADGALLLTYRGRDGIQLQRLHR